MAICLRPHELKNEDDSRQFIHTFVMTSIDVGIRLSVAVTIAIRDHNLIHSTLDNSAVSCQRLCLVRRRRSWHSSVPSATLRVRVIRIRPAVRNRTSMDCQSNLTFSFALPLFYYANYLMRGGMLLSIEHDGINFTLSEQ